jgi:hypothetical protein
MPRGSFADAAALVGAHRVEIAQQGDMPTRVGDGHVTQDLLDDELAATIGVGGGAHREILADGHRGRVAVDRGRGAEHHRLHPRRLHGLEQGDAAADVVVVIEQGLAHRLAHRLQPGEVDHGVDVVVPEHGIQCFPVADVGLDEGEIHARQFAHPDEGFGAAVAQVVQHDDVIAGVEEFHAGVGADVAGAAGDEDGFHGISGVFVGIGLFAPRLNRV